MRYVHPMAPTQPYRGGRRPKGERRQVTFRLPAEHYTVYKTRADELGINLVDYLVASLAGDHALPLPEYIPQRGEPEEQLLATG